MADSQSIPNTDSLNVASLAVAWEIVKDTYNIPRMVESPEDKLKLITNAVIKAYFAIINQKPIEK